MQTQLDAEPVLDLLDRTYADQNWSELGVNVRTDDLRPWLGVSMRSVIRCRKSGVISLKLADRIVTHLGYNLVELYGNNWDELA